MDNTKSSGERSSGESGQNVVEYALLIVMGVTIMLGLLGLAAMVFDGIDLGLDVIGL